MEKVIVSKEVAEAIEFLKAGKWAFANVISTLVNGGFNTTVEAKPLNRVNLETVARAYLNGYEIEKTPEEKVHEYFVSLVEQEEIREEHNVSGAQFRQGWQSVQFTLDLLGISIKGVNA